MYGWKFYFWKEKKVTGANTGKEKTATITLVVDCKSSNRFYFTVTTAEEWKKRRKGRG